MSLIKLTNAQQAQIESEGWAIFEIDAHGKNVQIQKTDEGDVFKNDKEAWGFVIEKAIKGFSLHGYILSELKIKSPNEFQMIAKDNECLPTGEDNYKRTFLNENAEFIYSDNGQWQCMDGDLCMDDKNGYPVWPGGEVVNGRFTLENFKLNQVLMTAALKSYSAMDVKGEDFNINESAMELAAEFKGALSQSINISIDEAYQKIKCHIEKSGCNW